MESNPQEILQAAASEALSADIAFPSNVTATVEIFNLLNAEDCQLDRLAPLLNAEPLIASRLVAAANSVAYTRYSAGVSNVKNAIKLLGSRQVQTIVASVITRQMAASAVSAERLQLIRELWSRCACVAAASKVLAAGMAPGVSPDTAQFAGTVHRIGLFYLLSRIDSEKSPSPTDLWLSQNIVDTVTLAVLKRLRVSKPILEEIENSFYTPSFTQETFGLACVLRACYEWASNQSNPGRICISIDQAHTFLDERSAQISAEASELIF